MSRVLLGLVVLGLVLMAWGLVPPGAQAIAQSRSIRIETLMSTTPNGKPAAALVVNGELVAQLAKDQRSRSPARNISVAASLITAAYRSGQAELVVRATDNTSRRYALFLNGQVLLVATDMEGKAWGAAPEELAQTWYDNLERAWALDPPAPAESGGTTAAPLVSTPAVLAPSADTAGTLSQATSVARSDPALLKLTISNGHTVFDPPSHTQLADSAVPAALTAQITGNRLSAGAARESITQAILSHAGLAPGTRLNWRVRTPANTNLGLSPGQQRRISIEYAAGDASPSNTVDVLLENSVLPLPRESMTFFSNIPEQVVQPQLLYYASLPPRESGRLVFHHQNQGRGELELVARVVNTGGEPAAVHVIPGLAEPDINTFYIGFKSAEAFWYNLNAGAGYVLHVPAGGQAYLAQQRLKPGYTGSGYLKLTNLANTGLRLETLVLAPGSSAPRTALSGNDSTSHAVFPAPYYVITETYEVGDPWMYLRLGADSPASLNSDAELDGSYGMTHSFNIELHNPHNWPALVFAVLRGSAGEVKGQFFIDDEYVATPLVGSGDEQLLKEIPLKPGETKLLKIKALPLNGGFYPASIILRESRYP